MVPKVSVILTSRNRWPLLRDAVESVLSQTYRNVELIVVDDSDEDGMEKKYLRDLHVRGAIRSINWNGPSFYRRKRKMVAVMVNNGLARATGDLICYLCDDDYYLPNKIERMVEEHPGGKAVVVDRVRWEKLDGSEHEQRRIGRFMYPKPLEPGHNDLVNALKDSRSNFIAQCSAMHAATKTRWPTDLGKTPVDWRFWLSLHRNGFEFKTIDFVGAVAHVPGTWRDGAKPVESNRSKIGGLRAMKDVVYLKNVGSKIEVLQVNGKEKLVHPGDRIEAKHATTPSGLPYPNFAYDDTYSVPSTAPAKEDDALAGSIPKIEEPLVPVEKIDVIEEDGASEPLAKKFPFKREAKTTKKSSKKKAAKKTRKSSKKTAKKAAKRTRKSSKKVEKSDGN